MSDRTQDAKATDNELTTVQAAARALLAALKKFQDRYLDLDEPYCEAIDAIAQAEQAGITVNDEPKEQP